MSASSGGDADPRPPHERAEEMMERFSRQASRTIRRAVGRAREELEDLVAEARTLNERDREAGQPADRTRPRS